MKKNAWTHHLLLLHGLFSFFLIISCATSPSISGKWQEVGRTASLEFMADGTFKAVDNEKMAVSGRYTLHKDGDLELEIYHKNLSTEIVKGKISVDGDELFITPAKSDETEHYKLKVLK